MSLMKPFVIVAHPSLEVRGVLARRIEGAGCTVQTCGDGDEALNLARREPPQAVLVGVGLDGGRGAAIAERIRRVSADIRILLTPMRDEDLRRAVESVVREAASRDTGTTPELPARRKATSRAKR